MTWIQTYTGRKFHPLNPCEDEIDIVDIAHALALTCRYTGHCMTFFSVAQHSVMVSRMVPECDALWGLMHDSAEAYVTDVALPIKPYTRVGAIEDKLLLAIANHFSLTMPIPSSVKTADLCCLERERRQLMGKPPEEWSTAGCWDGDETTIRPWKWTEAKFQFLERFRVLYKEHVE